MSNINPQSIDGTYPIAGQDNNSQGFRSNFTNIINNFTFAAAELNDLQTKAILKASLGSVGQTGTPTNDMNYAYLTNAQMIGAVETKNSIGNVTSGSFTVDWEQGHYQTVDLAGNAAILTFSATWPATNLYARLRLQCNTYADECALTLPAAVSTNISSVQGANGQVITLPAGAVYVFEFSTSDAGATVTIEDVLRNYNNITRYQISAPTANVAVTALPGRNRLILTPTGSIISFGANVTLPSGNVDGLTYSISSNVATTLSVQASNGTSVDPYANVQLAAGASATYLYSSTGTKWFKIG